MVVRIWNSQFTCNDLKNKKLFLDFLFHFLNLHQILNILKKKMIVIANVFLNSQTVKILVRALSKKRRFRTRFGSQHVKPPQILVKSIWEGFYYFIFFIILREVHLDNVSPSVRWNFRGVCENIDFRWQVSCSKFWQFAPPNSNATKTFFSSFCFISGFYIKFWTFWKKRWSS